jgi:hypothetical protein
VRGGPLNKDSETLKDWFKDGSLIHCGYCRRPEFWDGQMTAPVTRFDAVCEVRNDRLFRLLKKMAEVHGNRTHPGRF